MLFLPRPSKSGSSMTLKSVSEQMIFVPFVRLNPKLYTISFTNVLTRGDLERF